MEGQKKLKAAGITPFSLGGKFSLNGSYNTKDINNPVYNMNFNLTGLQVKPVWDNFNTVQALAPAGKFVNGLMNSTINFNY